MLYKNEIDKILIKYPEFKKKGLTLFYEVDENDPYDYGDGRFIFRNKVKNIIIEFKIKQLPGCCGVCVIHGLFIYSNKYKNIGLSEKSINLALELSKEMGYSIVIATDIKENSTQFIAKKLKFRRCSTFNNKRTKNKVNIYIKKI